MKVIVTKTGDNFLLSHADLKNLGLLPIDFPEYIGERRMALYTSDKELEGAYTVHEEEESDDIDPTEYFSDEPKDKVDSTPEGAPLPHLDLEKRRSHSA